MGDLQWGDSGGAQRSHPEFLLSGYTPQLIGMSAPIWIPLNYPSEAEQNPVGDGKGEAEGPSPWPRGCHQPLTPASWQGAVPPSHLPPAGLQQDPGAEQAPELPQE